MEKLKIDYIHMFMEVIHGISGYFIWRKIKNSNGITSDDVVVVFRNEKDKFDEFMDLENDFKKAHGINRVFIALDENEIEEYGISKINCDMKNKIIQLTKKEKRDFRTFYRDNNMKLSIFMCSLSEPNGRNIYKYASLGCDKETLFKVGVLGII